MRLQDIKVNEKVIYVPELLLMGDSDKMIKEENLGKVTSLNDKYVFVKYKDREISQATRPEDLFTLRNRPDLSKKI